MGFPSENISNGKSVPSAPSERIKKLGKMKFSIVFVVFAAFLVHSVLDFVLNNYLNKVVIKIYFISLYSLYTQTFHNTFKFLPITNPSLILF